MDNKGLPRLSVHRTNKYTWAQIINDKRGHTLLSLSTKNLPQKTDKKLTKTEQASALGTLIAKKALKVKIIHVRFDKGAHCYHGRVKALAESARKAGLKF